MKLKKFKSALIGGIAATSLLSGVFPVCIQAAESVAAKEAELPVVKSISLDKKEAKPGDVVKVTATLEGDSNINSITVGFRSLNDTRPVTGSGAANLTKQADGTFEGLFSVDDSMPNGEMIVYLVTLFEEPDFTKIIKYYSDYEILDYSEHIRNHDDYEMLLVGYYPDSVTKSETEPEIHSNLNDINLSGFTITESKSDIQGPVINNITFDKTELKRGEIVTLSADVTDESDISEVRISTLYHKDKVSDDHSFMDDPIFETYILFPDESGNLNTIIEINDSWEDGYYDIVGVEALDRFHNLTTMGDTDKYIVFKGINVLGDKEPDINNSEENPEETEPEWYKNLDQFYEQDNKYFGFPFVIENDKGENLSADTKIELYKITDGREVKVDNFAQTSIILNPYYSTGADVGVRYLSMFDMYKLDVDDLYSDSALDDLNGNYIIKCVDVPEGYEKFSDITFTFKFPSIKNEIYYAKGLISDIKAQNIKAYIADKNPDYIKDQVMTFSDDNLTIRETDFSEYIYSLEQKEHESIASEYDLFTIVLNRSSSLEKKSAASSDKTTTPASGTDNKKNTGANNQGASNVNAAGVANKQTSTSVKSANTGDDNSTNTWIVLGGVTAVGLTAASAIYFRRRKTM